jgi:alpha-tubulin suppressor-like RCC1 family protein
LYDGSVLGWGQNMCGQLGNGKNFSFGEEDEAEVGEDVDEAEDRYMCETAPNRVRCAKATTSLESQISEVESGRV